MTTSHPQAPVPKEYYRDLWMDDEVADGYVLEGESSSVTARDIMTPVVHKVHVHDPIPEVVQLMLDARIHRVRVTNGREIVGIISTMDLVRMLPDLLHASLQP